MKIFRAFIAIIALVCLLCSFVPAAYATPEAEAEPQVAESSPTSRTEEELDALFAGKSWEQVIEDFFFKHGIDHDRITLAYYNTVTGEENYILPDKYMVAGSLYKVPLNMVYAERVYRGEMDWNTAVYTVEYQVLMEESIINSSNNFAEVLWRNLGNGDYMQFRRIIAPYMGEDADTVDWKYYENNFFTARQMMHCMKLLYNESERFPKIIDTMKKAEPTNYFSLHEDRYDVAHKYGFLQEEYNLYMNDCGIVFTEEPFIIVMFTDNVENAYEVLGDYCVLMADYTTYNSQKRNEANKLAEELLRKEEEAAAAATPQPTPMPIPQSAEEDGLGGSALLAAAGTALVMLGALIAVILCKRNSKMSFIGAALAIIFAGCAVLLCILGSSTGTLVAKPEGDPKASVQSFFDAVDNGDYTRAYSYIKGYSSLGLEKAPADEVGAAAYQALQDSYSFSLYGDPSVDKLKAYQQVQVTYLDLNSIQADVEAMTMANLNEIVQNRPKSEVYDANDKYLPEVTQEAYSKAVITVLEAPKKYYVHTGIMLELEYTDGRWMIIPSEKLLHVLIGGTAY